MPYSLTFLVFIQNSGRPNRVWMLTCAKSLVEIFCYFQVFIQIWIGHVHLTHWEHSTLEDWPSVDLLNYLITCNHVNLFNNTWSLIIGCFLYWTLMCNPFNHKICFFGIEHVVLILSLLFWRDLSRFDWLLRILTTFWRLLRFRGWWIIVPLVFAVRKWIRLFCYFWWHLFIKINLIICLT